MLLFFSLLQFEHQCVYFVIIFYSVLLILFCLQYFSWNNKQVNVSINIKNINFYFHQCGTSVLCLNSMTDWLMVMRSFFSYFFLNVFFAQISCSPILSTTSKQIGPCGHRGKVKQKYIWICAQHRYDSQVRKSLKCFFLCFYSDCFILRFSASWSFWKSPAGWEETILQFSSKAHLMAPSYDFNTKKVHT